MCLVGKTIHYFNGKPQEIHSLMIMCQRGTTFTTVVNICINAK